VLRCEKWFWHKGEKETTTVTSIAARQASDHANYDRGVREHVISVLVENRVGVLARVAGLFTGRGFNIESLAVAPTEDPTLSRMTIVSSGDARIIEQVTKQLNKLIDVIKVVDLSREHFAERELILVKVRAESEQRAEILRITDIFRGNIIDVSPKSYVIEVTGDGDKIRAFVDLIKPIGILEIVRTGPVALSRGSKALS
jgi:acetolactate synthase-1/3 small subunit